MPLDFTSLQPLADEPAAPPSAPSLDYSGLKPLDFSGLKPLDEPTQDTGLIGAIGAGFTSAGRELGQTAQAFTGPRPTPSPAPKTVAEQPVELSDLVHPYRLGEKILYGVAQSSPALVAGIAVGSTATGAAAETGPLAPFIGLGAGAIAYGATSAVQQLGPVFADELSKNPSDPDAAWSRTLSKAAQTGGFGTLGWAAFRVAPFANAVKNLVFQAFVVQPGVAVAERATQNVEQGRPATEGLGDTYAQGVASTAIPVVGVEGAKALGRRIAGRTEAAQPPPTAETAQPAAAAAPSAPADVPAAGDMLPRVPVEAEAAALPPSQVAPVAGAAAPEPQPAEQAAVPPETDPAAAQQALPPGYRILPPDAQNPFYSMLSPEGEVIGEGSDPEYLARYAQEHLAGEEKKVESNQALTNEWAKLPPGYRIDPPTDVRDPYYSVVSADGEVIAQSLTPIGLASHAREREGLNILEPPELGGTAEAQVDHEREALIATAEAAPEAAAPRIEDIGERVGELLEAPAAEPEEPPPAAVPEQAAPLIEQIAADHTETVQWAAEDVRPEPAPFLEAPKWFLDTTPYGRMQLAQKAGYDAKEAVRLSKMNWVNLARDPQVVARLEEAWRRGLIGEEAAASAAPPISPVAPPPEAQVAAPPPLASTPRDPREIGQEMSRARADAKGKIDFHGLDFDYNFGSTQRDGQNPDGSIWRQRPQDVDDGHLTASGGARIPTYVGDYPESPHVFIIDRANADTRAFDGHQVMLGFRNWPEARAAYENAFSDDRGAERIGNVTPMTLDETRTWLRDGDMRNPIGQSSFSLTEPQKRNPAAAAPSEKTPPFVLADMVTEALERRAPIAAKDVQAMAERAFGGTLAESKFTRDQMYDALELGVNQFVTRHPEWIDPQADVTKAKMIAERLEAIKNNLPTQTVRAGEKDRFQQFSTPPDYSYLAAWMGNIRAADRVLEPSAGNGSLVAMAKNAHPAEVYTNELFLPRAANVESLGVTRGFRENAEQLHNVLPEDVRPSLVLMNPPFSATAGRMGDKTVIETGARHIEQALQRLEPGGRLVAIVGRGMGPGMARFANWWGRIGREYDVRANVGVPGSVYQKYGTTFGTRLLVIDKNLPSGRPPILGEADSIPTLMERLNGVRNDRQPIQTSPRVEPAAGTAGEPLAAQPTSEEVAPASEPARRPEPAVSGATPVGGVPSEPVYPGPRGEVPGGTPERGGGDAGSQPQPRPADAVVADESEHGRPVGTERYPAGGAGVEPGLGGGRAEPDGVVLRPEGEPGSVLPPGGEPSGLTQEGSPPEAVRVDELAAQPESAAEITEQVYEPYRPQRIQIAGARPHPGNLVQSAAMASVMPPSVDYAPRLPKELVSGGALSDAQLEAITYAGHAHSQILPAVEGEIPYRRGYFIGDGCVAAGTRIFNPLTGQHTPIECLVGKTHWVLSLTDDGFKPHKAAVTFKKGYAALYAVRFADGREIIVTDKHRFLTASGWASIRNGGVRVDRLLACAGNGPLQDLGDGPSVPHESGQNLRRKWPSHRHRSVACLAWHAPTCRQDTEISHHLRTKVVSSFDTCVQSSVFYSRWDRVLSIRFVGFDAYYDMYVPGPQNYLAEGCVNHNTGVGKGREVAGIILDNWMQGRRRALWLSESKTLLEDARRDWSGLGRDPKQIFDVGKVKPGNDLKASEGIGFLTYSALRSSARMGKDAEGKTIKGRSRLDQLVDWLGKDFNGVIAFDEAHNLGNAIDTKGKRGRKEAAKQALVGLELQQKLPDARVVYVSATGATEVANLAYADRLGLWGRNTAFPNRLAFISNIGSGGIAAMELVARDMKAMGSYISRNLSYDDVKYDRIEHNLTPEQREIYDELAEGWQHVLNNFEEALIKTGPDGERADGGQRGQALSAFWSAHQRFFNQIITAMQMPTVLRAVERDVKDGKQAVLQLVNTNEAAQRRALETVKGQEDADLEDLDMTPRTQLMELVRKCFPVAQMESYVDESGNVNTKPAMDSHGRIIENREAVAMREALLDRIGSIRVPEGPLESLINYFGPDKVAEVTGRKARVVVKPDEKGQMRAQEEKRSGDANSVEADAFQNGKKPIMVFSQAGGTGRSYHADLTAPSRDAQRSHYLVQPGWRADKAIQGFGRTHRTNQASAPIFHLVTTDLQGQRRFISSIARRLSQLGALTKGERRAGESGMFSARDNLESEEARAALRNFWRSLDHGEITSIRSADFERQTGLRLRDKNGNTADPPEITQFLNRLLSLKFAMQNAVFGEFETRLRDAVDQAAAMGTLDVGTETLRADRITKDLEKTVFTDPQSAAETKYVRLKVENRNKPANFDNVSSGRSSLTAGRVPVSYAISKRTGKIFAVAEASSATDPKTGDVTPMYRLAGPLSWDYTARAKLDGYGAERYWEKIDDPGKARDLWDKQVAAIPEYNSKHQHLITGAILPIWDRLVGAPKVYRLQTTDGERMLGRVIDKQHIGQVLRNLGAEAEAKSYDPAEVHDRIMDGDRATLANGWALKRAMVAGEPRIEVIGPSFRDQAVLERDGLFTERIGWNTRFFIPTGPRAAAIIGGITERSPVIQITQAGGKEEGLLSIVGKLMRDESGALHLPFLLRSEVNEGEAGLVEGEGRPHTVPPGGGAAPPPQPPPPPRPPPAGTPAPPDASADLATVMHTDRRNFIDRVRDHLDNMKRLGVRELEQRWLDELAYLKENERGVGGGELLPARESPTAHMRLSRNSMTVASLLMHDAQVRFNPVTQQIEPIPGTKGLIAIEKPLRDEGGQQAINNYQAWEIAKRSEELTAEGRERLVPPEFIEKYRDIDRFYQRPDGTNLFHQVRDERREFHKNLLDLGEAAGIINPESRALFERENYIPYYRLLSDEDVAGPAGGRRTVRSPIQRLKGGTAVLNNVFENEVKLATAMVQRSMENIARRWTVAQLVGTDALVPASKVAREMLEMPEVVSRMQDMGIDPDAMTARAKQAARALFTMLRKHDPNLYTLMQDGKPLYFEVRDPLLLRSLQAAGPQTVDSLTRILSGPARLLRGAVIFDPAFALAHNFRMALHSLILTGTSPFATWAESARLLSGHLNSDALKLMASGAISGKYDVGMAAHVRRQIESQEYQNTLINTPLKAARLLRQWSENAMRASDMGPRVAVYKNALAEGAAEAEAIDRARDLLDFSTHGDGAAARFLTQTIPFLNARWQGIARTGRGLLGGNRNGIMLRMGLMAAASLALWYENYNDPRWQRLEDWDKQYAWHIWLGDLHFRIPKPFEIGAIAGSLPEILADYYHNGSWRQLQNAGISLFANIFKFNPVPVAVRPALDAWFNVDSYTGRPIVNEAERSRVPDMQYGPTTSPSVVAATHAFNAVSPHQVSPDVVQHLVRGYLAGWGAYISAATDAIGETAGWLPQQAAWRAADYPVISRFVREVPEAGNRIQTDFYDLKTAITQVGNSIKDAERLGDAASAQGLMRSHPEYSPALEKALQKFGLSLAKQRSALSLILRNPGFTAEAKRKALDDFYVRRDQQLDSIVPLLRQAEGLPGTPSP